MENNTRQKKERTETDIKDKREKADKLLAKHQHFISTHFKNQIEPGRHGAAIKSYLGKKAECLRQQRASVKKHEATLVGKESQLESTRKHLDSTRKDAR